MYTKVDLKQCYDRTGKPPLGTRWLDHNKGDSRQLDLRSRLVVQETKRVSSILADDIAGVFSATPPLESLRFLFSLCMSLPPLAGQIFDKIHLLENVEDFKAFQIQVVIGVCCQQQKPNVAFLFQDKLKVVGFKFLKQLET